MKFLHFQLRDLLGLGASAEALLDVETPLQIYESHKLQWEDQRWELPATESRESPTGASSSSSYCNNSWYAESEAYGGYQPY